MFIIWKSFCWTRFNHVPEHSYDKGHNIYKNPLALKKD